MIRLETVGAVYTILLQNAKCTGKSQKYNLIETIKEAVNASNCGKKIKQTMIV